MPDMDEGAFVLDYNMPVGTSLAQTDKVMRRVEAVLLRDARHLRLHPPDRGRARASSPPSRTPATSSSASSRPASAGPTNEIFDALREELKAEVPELETEFVPLVQDQINDLAGVDSPIEVKVFGPDFAMLRELAEQVGKIVEKVDGVVDVNAHVYLGNPDIVDPARQRPDGPGRPDRAGHRGSAQRRALRPGGQHGPRAGPDDQDPRPLSRPGPVRPRPPGPAADQPGDRDAAATGGASPAAAAGIGFVPLGQLATIRTVRSPNELWRENQQPVITVSAELEKRDLGSVNRELQDKLAELKFPPGYRWELAGSYRAQQESFASLLTVLIVAAALVFLLLGFQFQSLTLPLLIFLAQPISLASALFALWITGTPLNVSSFMGAILLIGLDVKNGIILIEYIGQLRERGDAAARGPAQGRPHPVPADLDDQPLHDPGPGAPGHGLGPGAQMQQPLAIAVIGGLITNMLLTRLLIPVGYLVLVGRRETAAVVSAEPWWASGSHGEDTRRRGSEEAPGKPPARPGGRGLRGRHGVHGRGGLRVPRRRGPSTRSCST